MRTGTIGFALALIGATGANAGAPTDELTTYRAVYRVERDGNKSGESEWSLTYDAERGVYRFVSSLSVVGALRFALPNPIVERAEFEYDKGEIVPIEFWYEDGTRNGDENVHISFDWRRRRAVASSQGESTELELSAGVLDRASMQVAVMRDMASADGPSSYKLADGDSIKVYNYSSAGQEAVQAPAGTLETHAFVQQREGSSRRLLVWAAPEIGFLPVRMEQQKDGQTDTTFTLEFVEMNGSK
jgi:Protein of unknown function (DUF3108)